MVCKYCGKQIPKGQKKCPTCGMARGTGTAWAIILACLVLLGAFVCAVVFGLKGTMDALEKLPQLSWQEIIERQELPSETQFLPQTEPVETEPAGTEPAETEPRITSENPYWQVFLRYPDFVFSDSDKLPLQGQDLKDLDIDTLVIARNEIFARHGYLFTDPDLLAYFSARPWYDPVLPSDAFSPELLSTVELDNGALIRVYEKRAKGVVLGSENPYKAVYDPNRSFVIPESKVRELEESELYALTEQQLVIARNEIMARHGYTFSDEHLLAYFLQYDWYLPNTAPGKADTVSLSEAEQKNMALLQQVQDRKHQIPELNGLDDSMTYLVEGPGITVTLPAYWQQWATIQTEETSIRFRERTSSETIYGGHLFTLVLSADKGYTEYPSYRALGQISGPNAELWDLVAIFPTDVQFAPGSAELYQKMYEQFDDIVATVSPKEGYIFIPS